MKKIYLLRHFKVKDKKDKRLNSFEFNQWVDRYDNTALEYDNILIPKVDKVYVSTQNRAILTAKFLNLDFEKTNLLIEVEAKAFINTKFRFPKFFWLFVSRFFWFFNICKFENIKDTKKRANEIIQKIEEDKENNDILIISHGLFLKALIKQLKQKAYKTKVDFSIKNAKLYAITKC